MHTSHATLLATMIVVGAAFDASAQPSLDAPPAPVTEPAPLPPAPPAEPAPAAVGPGAHTHPQPAPAPPEDFDLSTVGLDPSASFDDKLNIYGFADFRYTGYHLGGSTPLDDTRAFGVGHLNLYLAKNLTRRWRTLTEVRFMFTPNGTTNADGSITNTTTQDAANDFQAVDWGGIRIERAYLEYDLHPSLTIRAGHWLSPYGIWNSDHGSPTIISPTRPYVIGAQVIPEHQTGIEAFGTTYLGEYQLGYHATVSNGRSPAEAIGDPDRKLAFGGRLALVAPWSGTVTLGVSAYAGRATNLAPSLLADAVSYDEVAYAADVEWQHDGFLAQGEIMSGTRRYVAGKRPVSFAGFLPNGRDIGGYGLVGYRFARAWNAMPFALLEFYNPLERTLFREFTGAGVGVNFRPAPTVVLKLMVSGALTDGVGMYGELGTLSRFAMQAAWVF